MGTADAQMQSKESARSHVMACRSQSLDLAPPLLPKGSKTMDQQESWCIRLRWPRPKLLRVCCEIVSQKTLQKPSFSPSNQQQIHQKEGRGLQLFQPAR